MKQLVDRLLASPHYGERWARRWLDLARYADTNGYEKDRTRSIWPYRDWVIRALNADMPFDQFTVEQIAGDLLPARDRQPADRHRVSSQHDAQRRRRHRPAGIPLLRDDRPGRHHGDCLAGHDPRLRAVPHAQVRPDPPSRLLPVHGPLEQRRRARDQRHDSGNRAPPRRAGSRRSRLWSPISPIDFPPPKKPTPTTGERSRNAEKPTSIATSQTGLKHEAAQAVSWKVLRPTQATAEFAAPEHRGRRIDLCQRRPEQA